MDAHFAAAEAPPMPGELNAPVPRRTRLNRNGKGMIAAVAIYLIMAAIFAGMIAVDITRQSHENAALRSSGQETTGEFTYFSKGNRIHYTFTVNGAWFNGSAIAPQGMQATLHRFDYLPIRYLPANPAINHPAAWEWTVQWGNFLAPLLPGFFIVLFAVILHRDRQLVANGAPAVGTVLKCNHSRSGFLLSYEFRTADGNMVKGNSGSPEQFAIGTHIWILYLPENPKRNESYSSTHYRVVD